MAVKELFEQAVIDSKNLVEKPSNNVLLQLYGLFKQAISGDINADAPPNAFDFEAKAKFNAWQELKGKPPELAMQEYADLIAKLKG